MTQSVSIAQQTAHSVLVINIIILMEPDVVMFMNKTVSIVVFMFNYLVPKLPCGSTCLNVECDDNIGLNCMNGYCACLSPSQHWSVLESNCVANFNYSVPCSNANFCGLTR